MTTLKELRIGKRARILDVAGGDTLAARILEMGLTPGEVVVLRSIAPLGDPLEVEIRGYRLSLRRAEAARVTIQHLD
ncbi:MAG TPA: ferrous iron transport protein A [Pirellulaceae bacterium]